jgi:hypothetical protein
MPNHTASSPKGFVVLYKWAVDPEHEEAFRERWHLTTLRGRELGALGSCLTRDASGCFVAIALWPSEAARAAAFEEMGPGQPWVGAQRIDEAKLHVEDDLWIGSPFGAVRNWVRPQ